MILTKILNDKIDEVAICKKQVSIDELHSLPYFMRRTVSLKGNICSSPSGIISEFKKKSPSKGWINESAKVIEVTKGYSDNGASGISILTDNKYFGGCDEDLISAREYVNIPILRKDFIVDEYQIYESKAIGADVILLIAAALTKEQTLMFAKKAKELSLEVLLEVHNQDELSHLNDYIDIVGVNNRNLKTFEVDVNISIELSNYIPQQFVKISESGISSVDTVLKLREYGFKGFLMGENFMKEANPADALGNFIRRL
jgi:indole-3-glycerol phosphate synthase